MPQTLQLPRQSRVAEIRAQSFNPEAYTVDLVFTTGATVRRLSWRDGPYDEELVVTPKSVRLDFLNNGAPFLNTHDDWDLSGIIGSVVPRSAKIVGGQGLATVQLSRREDVAGFVQDIKDGVIRNISCGYVYHTIEKTERDGSVPLWRVTDWEPLELSAVPIPADRGAQFRAGVRAAADLFPCIVNRSASAQAELSRIRMRMRERAVAH
jgi:phage head maturation protease